MMQPCVSLCVCVCIAIFARTLFPREPRDRWKSAHRARDSALESSWREILLEEQIARVTHSFVRNNKFSHSEGGIGNYGGMV